MKTPKCEVKLPRGYRWVKKGEKFLMTDLTWKFYGHSYQDPLRWIPLSIPAAIAQIIPKAIKPQMAIRKK